MDHYIEPTVSSVVSTDIVKLIALYCPNIITEKHISGLSAALETMGFILQSEPQNTVMTLTQTALEYRQQFFEEEFKRLNDIFSQHNSTTDDNCKFIFSITEQALTINNRMSNRSSTVISLDSLMQEDMSLQALEDKIIEDGQQDICWYWLILFASLVGYIIGRVDVSDIFRLMIVTGVAPYLAESDKNIKRKLLHKTFQVVSYDGTEYNYTLLQCLNEMLRNLKYCLQCEQLLEGAPSDPNDLLILV